jgi:hypothetical protein
MADNSLAAQQDNTYTFPSHRITRVMRDASRTPVVLVACGSFSPVTYLHLRMFEMARDFIKQQTKFEVVGGYVSPVNDQYKKPGLASASESFATLLGASTPVSNEGLSCFANISSQAIVSICARWVPSSPATG